MSGMLGIAYVIIGTGVLCILVAVARHERDAWLGRRLVQAAGSEELAELAIREAQREREIREKALDAATDAFIHRGKRAGAFLRLVK